MAWLADVCIVGGGPIQTAARMGKLDAVRCMVEELGFDVNASSQAGVTALTTAAIDERIDVMRYLLDKGADPKKPDDSGHFPLHLAAKYGLFCANTKLSVFRLAFTSWLLCKEDLKEWFIVLLNSLQLLTNAT